MTIADQITLLTNERAAIREALAAKGVDASTHGYASFAADIAVIPTGASLKNYFMPEGTHLAFSNATNRLVRTNAGVTATIDDDVITLSGTGTGTGSFVVWCWNDSEATHALPTLPDGAYGFIGCVGASGETFGANSLRTRLTRYVGGSTATNVYADGYGFTFANADPATYLYSMNITTYSGVDYDALGAVIYPRVFSLGEVGQA